MKKILNTEEAAEYIGMSKAWLERDRWKGAVVPFIQVGKRAVRYLSEDLDTYLKDRSTFGAKE